MCPSALPSRGCARPGSEKSATHCTVPAHSPLAPSALLSVSVVRPPQPRLEGFPQGCLPLTGSCPSACGPSMLPHSAGPPSSQRWSNRRLCVRATFCRPIGALTHGRPPRCSCRAERCQEHGCARLSSGPVFRVRRCTRPTWRCWDMWELLLAGDTKGVCLYLSSRPGMERNGRR